MHRRFPSRLDGLRSLPLFPKRPTSKPEGNKTESSTLQLATDLKATIPAPEGHKTESSTPEHAPNVKAMISALEGYNTESSTLQHTPNVKAMIPTPEGHKTESSTLQSAHEDHATITTPEEHKTESSTPQHALDVNAMIPTPEGHKTESSTLQSAHGVHATIVNPEVNETESPFYDPSKTPAKSSATIVAPEENETESTPVQGMEPGMSNQAPEVKFGYQRCRFGRDVEAGGEVHRQKALADYDEALSMAIRPGPKAGILLDDSRSVDRYELSDVIKRALAVRGITSLTPLQGQTLEAFVGRPTAWYIERPNGIPDQRTLELVGREKPEDLKEGEKAVEQVVDVKALRDMICLSETGSGKTLAYLLPLFEHLLVGKKVETEHRRPRIASTLGENIVRDPTMTPAALPFVLIVVPTRELAIQVYFDMIEIAVGTWIQPAAIYGGTNRTDQAAMLSRGCDILVATPGRLIDMLQWSYIDGVKTLSLEYLSHMVWDEADELLSLGFADQMEQILKMTMFSVHLHHWFFSSQYEEEHLTKAKGLIDLDYINMTFDMPDESDAIRYSAVKQFFIEVGAYESEKFEALMDIIGNNANTKIIVLCEKQLTVDELHSRLDDFNIPFDSTHGGYPQAIREAAMFKFKKSTIPLLVSTMGISGRGLNMKGVDCMIFWDMPETLEQYRWCVGRAGRLGNPAHAYVLYRKEKHPKHDDRFANFLELNDAEFDLDVDGKEIAKDATEEYNVEDNGWAFNIA